MQRINPIGLFCMLSFMTLFSQHSLAAGGTSPIASDNVTIGQLEAIQSRNFLLEQQVQTARLTRQLRESETLNSASQVTAPPVVPFIPASPMSGSGVQMGQQAEAAQAEKKLSGTVRLQEIYGKGSQLRARLLLPQGGVTEVVAGDQIPGSKLRVTSVSSTSVKLNDGTELSF